MRCRLGSAPHCFGGMALIGEKIKEYRDRRGYSKEELGRLCGFGRKGEALIAGFERDEGFPDLEKLKRIAEVLSVPLEVLCPVACCECPFRKKKKVIIHVEDDPGYETEYKDYRNPDEEGILYDNLD